MNLRALIAIIIVLCLFLVVVVYIEGVETGAASKLRAHPGYEGALA